MKKLACCQPWYKIKKVGPEGKQRFSEVSEPSSFKLPVVRMPLGTFFIG